MEELGYGDITVEILSWLPAKSVMRFKCVRKDWNSWITHLSFAKLHVARSQVRPSATRLLFEMYVNVDYSLEYPAKKQRAKKQRSLEGYSLELTRCFFYEDNMFICSNHCNGFVCLYGYKDAQVAQVYLYNVTTREIKALPFSMDYDLNSCLYLGFDMVTGKYKLLHIFIKDKSRRVTRILTLGTNSWRTIILPPNCFFFFRRTRHIYLHGFIYVIGRLAYFNFIEEKFGNLPRIRETRLNIMQTALWGKLVYHSRRRWGCEEDGNVIYDDNVIYDYLNKVFTKLVDYDESEKVALMETGTIDRTMSGDTVLATGSTIGAPTSLLSPN